MAQAPLPVDYSVSVRLLDPAGNPLYNQDAPLRADGAPTSTWAADRLAFDPHRLRLPETLPPGTYTLALSVYWYAEADRPLTVVSSQPGVAQATVARLGTLTLAEGG
ncbi:MAG: hypothetical protein HC915_10040 [Anaerolineae bacterium]|nr:hypothetical protein [Anaerolineae bacterium]